MHTVQNMKHRSRLVDVLLIILGGTIALTGTIVTELWLIPAREMKKHYLQLSEDRLSKLYQPLTIVTANGAFTMTSDIVFWKVDAIMSEYGHLAHPEVMENYLDFRQLCGFAGYYELVRGSDLQKPLSENVILEIIRQRKLPLVWTAESLEKALQKEKAFQRALKKHYEEAYKAFLQHMR